MSMSSALLPPPLQHRRSNDGNADGSITERRHATAKDESEALRTSRISGKVEGEHPSAVRDEEQLRSQSQGHSGHAAMLDDWLETSLRRNTAAAAAAAASTHGDERAPSARESATNATDRVRGQTRRNAIANSDHARIMSAVAVLAVKCGAVSTLRGSSAATQRWVRAGALVAAVLAFGRLLAQRRERSLQTFRPYLQFRSKQLEAEFRMHLAPHATKDLARAFPLALTLVVLGGACHAGAAGVAAVSSPAWWAAMASLTTLLLAGWWACARSLKAEAASTTPTTTTKGWLTAIVPVALTVATGVGLMLSWGASGPASRPLWHPYHQKIALLVAFSFVHHLVELSGVHYAVAASAFVTFNAVAYAATPPATPAERRELARMNLYIALNLFLHLFASFICEHTERRRFLLAKEVVSERVRAQGLLTQMLPKRIIRRLEAKPGSLIACNFANVTIMFVTLQGFASLVASTPAKRLINFLNGVFSEFDALCAHHSVYKIETVSDKYLAGAGLLDSDRDSDHTGGEYAGRAAALARDLIRVQLLLQSVSKSNSALHDIPLQLKVGLHSGPVVAGIIGAKRLHYRAFGDTVNTASRMCSHGLVGKVHMSGATKELLEGSGFAVASRGIIEVKGKGPMETFFLEQHDVDDSHMYTHASHSLLQHEADRQLGHRGSRAAHASRSSIVNSKSDSKVAATVRSVARLLLCRTGGDDAQHHDQPAPSLPLLAASVSPSPPSTPTTKPKAKSMEGLLRDSKEKRREDPGSKRRESVSLDFINVLLPMRMATMGKAVDGHRTDATREPKNPGWWRVLSTLMREKPLHQQASAAEHSGPQRPMPMPLEVGATAAPRAPPAPPPPPPAATKPWHPLTLQFKSVELETAYQRDHDKASLRQMQVVVGLFCSALLPTYTLLDILHHRGDSWLAVAFSLRLAYSLLALAALVYMSMASSWPRHRVCRALTQQRLMTGLAVAGSVVVMVLATMHSEGYHTVNEEVIATTAIALPVVMLACGLTFVHASAAAICAVALFSALMGVLMDRSHRHAHIDHDPNRGDAHITAGIAFLAIEFLFLTAAVREQERRMRAHFLLQQELVKQNRMSLQLIHDLVPPQIGRLLKRGVRSIVDHYSETTCLFSDMVGFTPLSMSLGAHRLVVFLNRLYTTFDSLCDKHRVYKVNIIGDAYVCVAGVPARDSAHAVAAVEMARSMLQAITALRDELLTAANPHDVAHDHLAKLHDVEMRIGLHSGPVVAGVVGTTALRYEVWGETVRIANKMESSGRPGRVHLSQECLINLRELHSYKFMIEIVGDGTGFLSDDRCYRYY